MKKTKLKTKLKPIIGMEVHVELNTSSKMFCGCPAKHFRIKPNTHTCPVCLGLPGALPVPNQKAVNWTILTGLALNCQINKQSKFDRKHYFYPDLAKGYQISQYDQPLSQNGFLIITSGKKIRLNRVHLEEDTGKLLHKKIKGQNLTLVDFNRSGVPLMEIVTEPDITSGSEAKEFLKNLRDILRTLKVSDCDMEKGSMRLEANISLSPTSRPYKVEVKNLNSFRFVDQAINYEIARQTKLIGQGITPKQETRGFNSKTKTTHSQRSKEEAQDYRYFPEPDIPPLVFTDEYINKIKDQLPTLPEEKISLLMKKYKLNHSAASLLVINQHDQYFKKAVKLAPTNISAPTIANLIVNKKINPQTTSPKQLITDLVSKSAAQISDEKLLLGIIKQVIKTNPKPVKSYHQGKTTVITYLIGQVMAQTKGQANPQLTKKLLKQNL